MLRRWALLPSAIHGLLTPSAPSPCLPVACTVSTGVLPFPVPAAFAIASSRHGSWMGSAPHFCFSHGRATDLSWIGSLSSRFGVQQGQRRLRQSKTGAGGKRMGWRLERGRGEGGGSEGRAGASRVTMAIAERGTGGSERSGGGDPTASGVSCDERTKKERSHLRSDRGRV